MRVLIMGAGAVGSYYGARLAQAGHEVGFVARGAQLAALRERGLAIRSGDGTSVLHPVTALDAPAAFGDSPDLILLTVKGYDTEAAIAALRPAVGPGTTILPLLNGVDSPDQLSAAFGPDRVLAGTTTINVGVVEPGVIVERGVPIRTTIAELSGAVTPRLEAIAAALRAAGGEVVVSTDAKVTLWLKFVLLAPHGTITAATGLPVGAVRELPEGAALYRQLIHEAVAVGRAAGAALPADIADTTINFVMATMPPTAISSMAVDFERRRRVELEQITGAIVRRGRALGVPIPGFAPLYAVLKARALAFGGLG
jgi:2-dehydropantoate 2-reductase